VTEPLAVAAPQERTGNVIQRNPNAAVALTSGSGVGALAVWLLGVVGVDMPPEIGAVVAGAMAGVVLFIGRRGIKGVIDAVWSGTKK
jgi:hypothetical protein